MNRVQTDAKFAMRNGSIITSATALPMINTQGLNNVGMYYVYNDTTGAVYFRFRGCGINTSTTSYWNSGTATATVATGTVTGSTFAIVQPFMTVEYSNTATGAGSGIMALSVF